MEHRGIRIRRPYKQVIGYWRDKPVTISVRKKRVAHGCDAIDVGIDGIKYLLACDKQAAIGFIVPHVWQCRWENKTRIAAELVRCHGWGIVDSGCVYNGIKSMGLVGHDWFFEKQMPDGTLYQFKVFVPHEYLTHSEVHAKIANILYFVEVCERASESHNSSATN